MAPCASRVLKTTCLQILFVALCETPSSASSWAKDLSLGKPETSRGLVWVEREPLTPTVKLFWIVYILEQSGDIDRRKCPHGGVTFQNPRSRNLGPQNKSAG
jgi:hypothetical protein